MKKFTLFLSAMLISLMSFAQTVPTDPELTTVTLTYELTKENVLDRMGRRTVHTTDDVLGDVQIILPTFNAETTEYTDASLVVGDATLAATATFTADAENNKEVYTATAPTEAGDTVYNVTMTVTYPATQEYTFFAMDDAEAVADDQGEDGESFIVYEVTGAGMLDGEPVEFELMIDQLKNIEGTIGEAFVMGTATSLSEEEGNLAVYGTAMDDAGNTYNIELWVPLAGEEVEIVITEEVDVTLYNLNLDVQGNMATVTAGGETLSFWMTLLATENYYGFYFSESFSNIWYGDAQLQPYGDGQYTPDGLTVAFISTPDAEGNATKYNFTLIAGDEPEPVKPEPTYTENALNTYAFGLESVLSDDVLTVTYRLNNSNATSVNVLVYNGEEVVATVAGTTTIGKNTVEVATATLPRGVQLTWGVEVNGTSVEVPTQEEKMYSLYCPHGLAIDTDPESENFGRILVAEAMQGVPASGYMTSGKGAGLYVFNPSFATDSVAYKGGNDFTRILASNGYQPWRVKISEDGRIFVSSLDLNGVAVWEVSKDLQTWTPVIAGTNDATDYNIYDTDSNFVAGLNVSMDVKGSGDDLTLLLYSTNNKGIANNQSGYRLDEYVLGTATTWTGTPKNIINGGAYGLVHTNVEFIYDGEGGYWFGASRSGHAGQPNLAHINAAGEQDYYTEDAGLYGGDGVLVHNGMLFKGKARTSSTVGNFGVWTIGKDADGNVTLTEKWTVAANGIGRNLNEFAVDYAENLYIVGNSGEKIIAFALPYSGTVTTPAASQYAFHIGELVEPVEMVGVVKRALTVGESTVVLTHEADGTAHIYNVVNGVATEVSQEGVIAVDTENPGSYLAISDIAVTEDGKLVANNYNRCSFNDGAVESGYKRGTLTFYIWNDLAAAPAIWFQSKASSNSNNSDQGYTMALTGTSTNANILVSGVHNTQRGVRMSHFSVVDGVFEDTQDGAANLPYYYYIGSNFKGASAGADAAVFNEQTQGANIQFHASPLADENWIIDGELTNPIEFTNPQTHGGEVVVKAALTEDLGKKYNGASYVAVGEQVLMVAPYATAEGLLAGVKVLDITAGLDAATEVAVADLEVAVEAAAAATAVLVVESGLQVTLVADATIHTLTVELADDEPTYPVMEDNITNLIYNAEEQSLSGGPSTQYGLEVFLVLGQDNLDGTFGLGEGSSIAFNDQDLTIVSGLIKDVDITAPAANAVIVAQVSESETYEFHLTMTSTPAEAVVIVVEDAAVDVEEWEDFPGAPTKNYSLTMTANWVNPADALTYPVKVEVLVYDPNVTEQADAICNVTVGDFINDPWLGGLDGCYLNLTTTNGVVTANGVFNTSNGVAIDLTISGKLPTTALDAVQVEVKTTKVIINGQLIIIKNNVEYNAQGSVVK